MVTAYAGDPFKRLRVMPVIGGACDGATDGVVHGHSAARAAWHGSRDARHRLGAYADRVVASDVTEALPAARAARFSAEVAVRRRRLGSTAHPHRPDRPGRHRLTVLVEDLDLPDHPRPTEPGCSSRVLPSIIVRGWISVPPYTSQIRCGPRQSIQACLSQRGHGAARRTQGTGPVGRARVSGRQLRELLMTRGWMS